MCCPCGKGKVLPHLSPALVEALGHGRRESGGVLMGGTSRSQGSLRTRGEQPPRCCRRAPWEGRTVWGDGRAEPAGTQAGLAPGVGGRDVGVRTRNVQNDEGQERRGGNPKRGGGTGLFSVCRNFPVPSGPHFVFPSLLPSAFWIVLRSAFWLTVQTASLVSGLLLRPVHRGS